MSARMISTLGFATLVCACAPTVASAASIDKRDSLSIKDQYELQERCGKRAEEVFRRDWGDGINVRDATGLSI